MFGFGGKRRESLPLFSQSLAGWAQSIQGEIRAACRTADLDTPADQIGDLARGIADRLSRRPEFKIDLPVLAEQAESSAAGIHSLKVIDGDASLLKFRPSTLGEVFVNDYLPMTLILYSTNQITWEGRPRNLWPSEVVERIHYVARRVCGELNSFQALPSFVLNELWNLQAEARAARPELLAANRPKIGRVGFAIFGTPAEHPFDAAERARSGR